MILRILALFLVALFSAQAGPAKIHVHWSGTPEVLAGKWVVVHMEDGTKVEGSWVSVTDRTFTMGVEKSSGRGKTAKGVQTLLRSELRTIRFRNRHVRGRVIGTIAGFYATLPIAAIAAQSNDAIQGVWGLVAIGGAVGGYYAGRSIYNATRELVIQP